MGGDASAEDALVRRASRSDRDAFAQLVASHHGRIRALLGYLARDLVVADDLAQQTFLQAWEKLGSFRGDSSARFGAWLTQIAYREFLQLTRRDRRWAAIVDTQGSVEELAADVCWDYQRDDPTGSVDSAEFDISRLLAPCSRVQAEALYMNFVLELTHEEIAMITQQPLGTVKSHISRGKKVIKMAFDPLKTSANGTGNDP